VNEEKVVGAAVAACVLGGTIVEVDERVASCEGQFVKGGG
jgi:hypothetical protein